MKCQYKVNTNTILELEGSTQKDLFQAMASAAEIFGHQWTCCGKCKDKNFKPRPVVRVNKEKQSFYELHCTNPTCRARYTFGQNKDMKTLFPQRKFGKSHAKKGEYKPNDGWVVWKDNDEADQHATDNEE